MSAVGGVMAGDRQGHSGSQTVCAYPGLQSESLLQISRAAVRTRLFGSRENRKEERYDTFHGTKYVI